MKMTVKDVMTAEVAAARANAPFHTVAELLVDRGPERRHGRGGRGDQKVWSCP
jgi:hypothetical protein